MEITLPENISEITLRQFLKLEELNDKPIDDYSKLKHKISIFTGIPFNKLDKVRRADFDRINSIVDVALGKDAQFVDRFELNGIKYGFIPNLDNITLGEYADMAKYGVDRETLPNLMAILFRPITKEDGSSYEIMSYRGTIEYVETIKEMPLNCVNGALVFFYNLANELQTATQKYLSEELVKDIKQPSTFRILAGIRQLKSLLTMTYSKSTK